jgi:hypothetical protein
VTGAYGDQELAARLFEIRKAFGGGDLPARGAVLQTAFDEILGRVFPTHAKRRLKARLVCLLALMLPHDMTCLWTRRGFGACIDSSVSFHTGWITTGLPRRKKFGPVGCAPEDAGRSLRPWRTLNGSTRSVIIRADVSRKF